MSQIKNKKIKRLRKAHIWPSVVFLIFSMILAYFSFITSLARTTTLLAEDRLEAVCANAASICRMFDAENGNEAAVIESIRANSDFTDAIFIFDENGGKIAGFGEPTYEKKYFAEPVEDLYSDGIYTMYYDTSLSNNLLSKNGDLFLKPLLEKESFETIVKLYYDPRNVVFEARFWLEGKLSGGRTAMIKCSAPLRFGDFSSSLRSALMSFGIMLLPLIFLFVNVIISVHGQRHITKLLYTDTVTAGNSFVYFEHTAEKILSARRNINKTFIIADITIMKYRNFCNYHGVHEGEALLEKTDRLISSYLNKGEFCAHSGKASFAVFMNCSDRRSGEDRVRRIIEELSEKSGHGGIVFHAGIYFSEPERSEDGRTARLTDPADCFNSASAARASLADENINAAAIYNDMLLEEQLWEHKVEEKMQKALADEEFKVYIQPKYDPVTEKLAGAEALVRWINEEDGFVPPGKFIPIFEKNGFITRLDDYMISHVAKLQAEWIEQGKAVVPISVNISRAHFSNPNLALHLSNLVDVYNVPHKLIEIELTESAFFDDKAALLKTVNDLSARGFEISMDDFGAGYSSLNSLKDLPLDVLKLDADFFRGENEENRGEIVVSEAITLAKKLNMRIVAEGVEKKEQVDFLAGQGCDMIQGYYFAKPMPADEYAGRLENVETKII